VQPTQVLAGLVALAFLAFGIVGFVRTGWSNFTGHDHVLGGFGINPLHNLLYVVAGAVGCCWRGRRPPRGCTAGSC